LPENQSYVSEEQDEQDRGSGKTPGSSGSNPAHTVREPSLIHRQPHSGDANFEIAGSCAIRSYAEHHLPKATKSADHISCSEKSWRTKLPENNERARQFLQIRAPQATAWAMIS